MVGLIRKYREVLALLALLALPSVTFLARRKVAASQNPIDRAVLWATAPLERAVDWTVGGAIDRIASVTSLRHSGAENVTLRRQLFAQRTELLRLDELSRENERLRGLLEFAKGEPLRLVTAPIIGDSLAPGALSRVVRVGAGLEQGIRRGMAVVAAAGVVGRVQAVFGSSADVQLVVDPGSAIAARALRSRARVTVAGTGSDLHCLLEFALRSDDLEEGDLLVTSGTDGVFPAGLPVGKVVEVQRKESGMFLRAAVVPAVEVRKVEDVMIVLGAQGDPEAPAASR